MFAVGWRHAFQSEWTFIYIICIIITRVSGYAPSADLDTQIYTPENEPGQIPARSHMSMQGLSSWEAWPVYITITVIKFIMFVIKSFVKKHQTRRNHIKMYTQCVITVHILEIRMLYNNNTVVK